MNETYSNNGTSGEEVATAAGFPSLARAIAVVGELENDVLSIFDTVKDPSSAVVNILGMLMCVVSITKVARNGEEIGSVSKLRNMIEDNNDKLQKIIKACRLS